MKKIIILLLLLPYLAISQAVPSDATQFENIQITNISTVTSVNKLANITTQGVINQIDPINLPFSLKQNFINILDIGGLGNGVFDNTTVINNALTTYKEVYFPDGNYLVTSLVNNSGAKITGSGVIRRSITGGTQQLNTGIDKYNYIFGQEYLSFVQSKQLADFSFLSVPVKVSWTGDSTTYGDATTAPYNLNNLFLSLAQEKGISNITSLNRGHSGINTEQWRTTYLASELAENPDLYIIRYGINDPYYLKNGSSAPPDSGDTYTNRRDIGDFTTSLRSALTTIRASKTQAQMSIILMSPNPTSDTPNGRDEKWYEQVRKVYIQAARDFKCAFIDTYGLWLDSRGAADIYMDNPYSDGRAIHPKDIYNTWIVSKVFDLVYPEALLNKVSDSHFYNQSSIDRLPTFSTNPSTYKRGLSINRVQSSDGWGVDGSAFTVFNRDNTGGQFNFSRLINNPEIYFRSINFDVGTGIPLGFSNNVRIWHSLNLPFSNNGTTISTALKLGGYYDAPYDTDTPDAIFTKIPANSKYVCYSVDTGTGFTGTPFLTTSKFSNTYGNQIAHFVSGTGSGKFLVRSMDAGIWSAWNELVNKTQLDASVRPYKIYTALLSQTGTSAPTVTVLENTLGGTIIWTRTGIGTYVGTLSGVFTANKTAVFFTKTAMGGAQHTSSAYSPTTSTVIIINSSPGGDADIAGDNSAIEIRVYP